MAHGLYDITALEPLIAEGRILLTPNSRLARHIKAEWDARCVAAGKRAWEPLCVGPLENWMLEKWELAISLGLLVPVIPLSDAQTLELWRQVINEQESQTQEYHLLRPEGAAELACKARDTLLRWQVDTRDRHIRQLFAFEQDSDTFFQWLVLFERRLASTGHCTFVDCLVQLPKLAGRLPAEAVALVEMEELQPLVRSALEALSADVHVVGRSASIGVRSSHSFSDQRAELQAVATWAATLHRVDPTVTIGIVLSDMGDSRVSLEYLLRREFDCLGAKYTSLPVNFSAGIPLAMSPLVRDALRLLALGLPRTTVPAVADLVQSRYLVVPDSHSALATRLVIHLYQERSEVLSRSDLGYLVNKVSQGEEQGQRLERSLHALFEMSAENRSVVPSLWVESIRKALSQWGWPGNQTLDSLEYQQLVLWEQTLHEFRAFDAICGAVDFAEALRLLRDCCYHQISQPETADSPIQVLGVLEAAGLAFDHIWVCGMQAGNWPRSPRPNPFIPLSMQTTLQMPHATPEREWSFSDSLLTQYARSCSILHASYYRQADGVQDMPSPLLEDFIAEPFPEPSLLSAKWVEACIDRELETIPDDQGPPLDLGEKAAVQGGSGLVEDQSQCPFKAFARRRLLIEALPRFNLALSAAERGVLLHDALFALWGEIKNHDSLTALHGKQEAEIISRSVQAAIGAVTPRRRYRLGASFWELESRRMVALLTEWLVIERQRSAFLVAEREQDIVLELAQLSIRLRVDRIDQLPDGSRVIIDYKSGESRIKDWLGSRPARPQLLLYAAAESDTAAALTFAQIRSRACRYVGLGRVAAAPGISIDIPRVVQASMDAEDWETLNACWRDTLERLAQDFANGAAGVDPLGPMSCVGCGLEPLCRVDIFQAPQQMEGE